jgi:hypothetical protein
MYTGQAFCWNKLSKHVSFITTSPYITWNYNKRELNCGHTKQERIFENYSDPLIYTYYK